MLGPPPWFAGSAMRATADAGSSEPGSAAVAIRSALTTAVRNA
jgi:hypothetical protein